MNTLKEYAAHPRLQTLEVNRSGADLLRDPLLNKGTAFTREERRELGLEGLLPHQYKTLEEQAQNAYAGFKAASEPLKQHIFLAELHRRNAHLFYRVLTEHLAEVMPIIYTPTVGLVAQRFSHHFRRAVGVWITPDMKGRIGAVLRRIAEERDVRLLVVTDNESVLGIGDQGAGGIAISVGKLALYCAGAGIHPALTLPVSLDVGTDNPELLEDDFYLGWRKPRLRGPEYRELVEEFVEAVTEVFPGALIQWEDFRKENALHILDRFRGQVPSFNDDIQGTGAVAAAGVLAALRVTGGAAADQRIVIHGAGAAGLGIARQLRVALRDLGAPEQAVERAVAVLDSRGLLVDDQPLREAYKRELAWPAAAAHEAGLTDVSRHDLASVVAAIRPTILIGTSGQPGAFTENVVRAMARHVERPVIMPFSNPTDHSEATPRNLFEWTEGRALVATGSPFADVTYDGRCIRVGQGNNMFVFPGIGQGALVSGARQVSDGMITAAVHALASAVSDEELASGLLYPSMDRLREVCLKVAAAVQARAVEEGEAPAQTPEEQRRRLHDSIWEPEYRRYHAADR